MSSPQLHSIVNHTRNQIGQFMQTEAADIRTTSNQVIVVPHLQEISSVSTKAVTTAKDKDVADTRISSNSSNRATHLAKQVRVGSCQVRTRTRTKGIP